MRKKGYKGRCEKRALEKSKEVCRLYDAIQSKYADMLQEHKDIKEIRCNVLLEGLEIGEYGSGMCFPKVPYKTVDSKATGCIKAILVKSWCE